jgi:hypothetical protein
MLCLVIMSNYNMNCNSKIVLVGGRVVFPGIKTTFYLYKKHLKNCLENLLACKQVLEA